MLGYISALLKKPAWYLSLLRCDRYQTQRGFHICHSIMCLAAKHIILFWCRGEKVYEEMKSKFSFSRYFNQLKWLCEVVCNLPVCLFGRPWPMSNSCGEAVSECFCNLYFVETVWIQNFFSIVLYKVSKTSLQNTHCMEVAYWEFRVLRIMVSVL